MFTFQNGSILGGGQRQTDRQTDRRPRLIRKCQPVRNEAKYGRSKDFWTVNRTRTGHVPEACQLYGDNDLTSFHGRPFPQPVGKF